MDETRNLLKEFRAFILRGNFVDLAIAVAIPVDTILSYNEPKRLLAPYHVYERFRHREGDDADEAAG